jgi:hypothetical protein
MRSDRQSRWSGLLPISDLSHLLSRDPAQSVEDQADELRVAKMFGLTQRGVKHSTVAAVPHPGHRLDLVRLAADQKNCRVLRDADPTADSVKEKRPNAFEYGMTPRGHGKLHPRRFTIALFGIVFRLHHASQIGPMAGNMNAPLEQGDTIGVGYVSQVGFNRVEIDAAAIDIIPPGGRLVEQRHGCPGIGIPFSSHQGQMRCRRQQSVRWDVCNSAVGMQRITTAGHANHTVGRMHE